MLTVVFLNNCSKNKILYAACYRYILTGHNVLPFNKLARVEPSCCLKNLFANSVLVLTENVYRYYEVFTVNLLP
jgi:hypothetical protein